MPEPDLSVAVAMASMTHADVRRESLPSLHAIDMPSIKSGSDQNHAAFPTPGESSCF